MKRSTKAGDLLAAAAKAECGPDAWISSFARKMDVNPRQFREWLAGEKDPTPEHMRRVRDILLAHRDALDEVARAITAFLETTK